MTDADIFDQLARLSQLRVQIPATAAPPAPSPGIASPPAVPAMSGYNHGLGASHAPPLGPHPTLSLPLQGLSTGLLSPSGVSCLPAPATSPSFLGTQPTSFNRHSRHSTRASSPPLPQPTGFQSNISPQQTSLQPNLAPQPTGFQPSLAPQPTGFGVGSPFGAGQLGGVPPVPSLRHSRMGRSVSYSLPTGFNPGFGQPSYGSAAPPLPGGSAQRDTNLL
ncbi:hypothetical protein EDB84DRAFT_918036 [Lactarius hengduanensis]|nr:hypothetical protein EDB84DRAFT_918036 [Lactarius hengduanensis]